jgi:protoporphyrinogen oxidase
MFRVDEDKTIHLTRGDSAVLMITAGDDDSLYTFRVGDEVRFKVFARKATETVYLEKTVRVVEAAEFVLINLSKDDTKIGVPINKPTNFWYEVELNPNSMPQTIVGYDEDGEKILILYPEGGDFNER